MQTTLILLALILAGGLYLARQARSDRGRSWLEEIEAEKEPVRKQIRRSS